MNIQRIELFEVSYGNYLVIPLTCESLEYYVDELNRLLKMHNIHDAILCIDIILKNGLRDRFYHLQIKGGKILINSIKRKEDSLSYAKIANLFFAKNWDYIEHSNLSRVQKFVFKKQLSIFSDFTSDLEVKLSLD